MKMPQVIALRHLGDTATEQQEIVQTSALKVIQLLLPPSGIIPTYRAQGEVLVHCLEGAVALRTNHNQVELSAGKLIHLSESAPFSLAADQDGASILITILATKEGPVTALIGE